MPVTSRLLVGCLLFALTPLAEESTAASSTPAEPWLAMDYGPFLTASVEIPSATTNFAYKGITIRLQSERDGPTSASVLFDTDLLRYAGGWTGGFLDLKGVVFDGEHWAYPRQHGRMVFHNPPLPGLSTTGVFTDPRPLPYGPLPRKDAHWKGLYLHDDQVVLTYTAGNTLIRETPGLLRRHDLAIFTRTLEVAPTTTSVVLQVATEEDRDLVYQQTLSLQPDTSGAPAVGLIAAFPPQPEDQTAGQLSLPEPRAAWTFDSIEWRAEQEVATTGGTLQLIGARRAESEPDGRGLLFQSGDQARMRLGEPLDFTRTDLTLAMRVRTESDGTLIAETPVKGPWQPNAKSLFIRQGRLNFDIGWVGCATSSRLVADGAWHHVALTWSHSDGQALLYVDGEADGAALLPPSGPLQESEFRLGWTTENFPDTSDWAGTLTDLRVYDRRLSGAELAQLADWPGDRDTDTLLVGVVGAPPTARWEAVDANQLSLRLQPSTEPVRMRLLLARVDPDQTETFAKIVREASPPDSLESLTHGGPPRWSPALTTQPTRGSETGPYAIDTLTAPEANPWHSWLRFGGLDFFDDPNRAVLVTWNGDVWTVKGVSTQSGPLTWQRVATGLFQPLGVRVVDEGIYVLGRDQITRLHDLNGDGEADYYENFNNDCLVSEHFHEFATDLQIDAEGNFYYIKCACHALPAAHPHHGTLLKVAPDGSSTEVVARGLRAVNGLGIGPEGQITCVDNQGHWMPANRINWIEPGGFYGNMWAWQDEPKRTDYDLPLAWIHNFVDRSGGTHLWVPDDRWGPLAGELITLSYGMGHMLLVLHETVDGVRQGGLTRFPLEFDTGVMRGVFHPEDGQLYAAGLFGWAGNKTRPGGFYRVRATGRPLHLPNRLHIAADGVVLSFTDPLDPTEALDPGNYTVQAWNYRWTAQYGSPDLRLDGSEGRDRWVIEAVGLSADRRTVFLRLPDVQPVMQMHLEFNLRGDDGVPIENFVHSTIHRVGHRSGESWLGEGLTLLSRTQDDPIALAPGLLLRLTSPTAPGVVDTRRSRLAAWALAENESASPFLPPGPFAAEWEGFLRVDRNQKTRFRVDANEPCELRINGELLSQSEEGSSLVQLRAGPNQLNLRTRSTVLNPTDIRLFWAAADSSFTPVPPDHLQHDPQNAALAVSEQQREGRRLFAAYRCAGCHQPPDIWGANAMPELHALAPALDGAGDRFQVGWLRRYLLDPPSEVPHTRMPGLGTGSPREDRRNAGDLAAFLGTLTNGTVSVGPAGAVETGDQLYGELGCVGCHILPGETRVDEADTRLSLDHVAAKWRTGALATYLQRPAEQYPWTRMPDYRLTSDEADCLATFLRDVTSAIAAASEIPGLDPGDPERGRDLLGQVGCLACHTLTNQANETEFPPLLALTEKPTLTGCLSPVAGVDETYPRFTLTRSERAALRTFLNGTPLQALQQDNPVEFLHRNYPDLRCAACHARDGAGDLWGSLTQPPPTSASEDSEDAFFDDEEAAVAGSVHLGRPALTLAGEKLRVDWLRRFLEGQLPYKPRPESQGRMPFFPSHGPPLAVALAAEHGLGPQSPTRPIADSTLAAIGENLTLVGDGFGCVACHDVAQKKALAGADTATVNFAFVADRLRDEYYWRYLRDPQAFRSGTMMPSFINPDGTTPIVGVLDGDGQQQFAAIWQYLLSLEPKMAEPAEATR